MVISSSEDESDHLERVAQAFSAQLSSPTATTPPHSRPMSSRLARRRRVISSPTSDTDSDSYVSCRQIKTPTKTGRSRKQLTPGQCLATSDIKRSEQPTNKRSVRSSTMSQRQKKVSGDSGKALESSESSSDGIRSTVRRKVPIAVSRLSDSDDSDPIAHIGYGARSHKCLGKPAPALVSNDGHSSSEEIITPSRKRRLAGAGAAPDSPNVRLVAASDQIVDDLHEDVEDLKETELRNHRTRATNRTPKKTKAQQQLELLKRRRAGRNVVDVSSGSEDNAVKSPRRRLIFNEETDSRDDETGVESEQLGDNDPPLTLEDEDLDQYDEDFVVEDEDEPLGAPHSLSEIPLEFTRHAHKKPIEHFKDAVEWMVHNLLNPAFPRDDPIYQVAVQKLDDEVRGLAGSKFMSAAWNTDFLSTLKAKPDIAYLDAHGLFEQHCEACNRSNHPAKFQLIFSGKPYNRQSLEEISDDEDEEDATKSQDGRFGGDEKSFYVGRTCCANAETSHALHHWRYALNQWVLEWLTRRGHTSADKIVERERWSTKKRTQYANDVVDGMEANGEVRVLYKEFKENLQAARDARVCQHCTSCITEVTDAVHSLIHIPMGGRDSQATAERILSPGKGSSRYKLPWAQAFHGPSGYLCEPTSIIYQIYIDRPI